METSDRKEAGRRNECTAEVSGLAIDTCCTVSSTAAIDLCGIDDRNVRRSGALALGRAAAVCRVDKPRIDLTVAVP